MELPDVNDEIYMFWSWFSKSHQEIISAVADRDSQWLADHLAPRLRAIQKGKNQARLNWEVGKGKLRRWSFCVSPTVKENIKLAQRIVDCAPEQSEWEYHVGRQAKPNWDFCFTLPDEFGKELSVDAANWHYFIKRTEFGAYILFIADCLQNASEQLKTKIAYLILDLAVGEMIVLQHVASAFIIDESRAGGAPEQQPMHLIRQEFETDSRGFPTSVEKRTE